MSLFSATEYDPYSQAEQILSEDVDPLVEINSPITHLRHGLHTVPFISRENELRGQLSHSRSPEEVPAYVMYFPG